MKRGCGCLAAVPVLIFGLIFAGVGLALLLSAQRAQSDFTRTEGIVVDLRPNNSSDGTTYTPVIEFEVDGDTYRFVSDISRSPAPDIGDTVGVLYNPTDPTDAVEDSALLWVLPGIALLVGLPVVAFGVFLLVRGFRRRPVDQPEGSPVPNDATPPTEPADLVTTVEEVLTAAGADPPPSGSRPATAQFRRVEPRGPDAEGRFQYRVVARDEAGNRYYSDWLDHDPTTQLLTAGVDELPLRWVGSRAIVEGF